MGKQKLIKYTELKLTKAFMTAIGFSGGGGGRGIGTCGKADNGVPCRI